MSSLVYFTILISLFSVAVTVSTHFSVVCCHFCCPMWLFQGHVACQNVYTQRELH